MRNLKRCLASIIGFLITLGVYAAPAGPRNDGRRPLRLTETTEILGTTLSPGSYDLRWTREPKTESVQLEITRGKSVLASGKGEWASSDLPYPHEALVYRGTAGVSGLAEIRFRNSAEWIKVDSSSTAAKTAAAASSEGGK